MNNRIFPIIMGTVAGAVGLSLFLGTESRAQSAGEAVQRTATRWEYRVRRIDDSRGAADRALGARKSASEATLDELGAEGWELVDVRPEGTNNPVFYFKRPLP